MLFATHISTLTASVNTIQSQIDELENQLKALRADKANLEAELQTVLTLEGAAESAINQAQSFIGAANSLDRQDLIATFWDAMATLQNGSVMGQLPPAPTAKTETEPTTPITLPPAPQELTETDSQPEQTTPTLSPAPNNPEFDPTTVPLATLKSFVRKHQPDSKTKLLGSLTQRKTWQLAATKLLANGHKP